VLIKVLVITSDMERKTPLLVPINGTFEKYVSGISRKGRKEYRRVMKLNERLEYKEVVFHKPLIEKFMDIWAHQLVRGRQIGWAFDLCHVQELDSRGLLRCFVAYENGEPIAAHFVEQHGTYIECHPPMYDKEKYLGRSLAKFMWFSLIKKVHEDNCEEWLDLGGGDRGTWREFIASRHAHANPRYKWLYVPERVKDHPEEQKPWVVCNDGVKKYLTEYA